MTSRTQLASGEILDGTILSIWLVQPADKPESVVVIWPQRPTPISPRYYSELAATVCRLGPRGRRGNLATVQTRCLTAPNACG